MEQEVGNVFPIVHDSLPDFPNAMNFSNNEKNKQRGSLTVFFAFAVIIISVIAGFFAYQNQQLVKELRNRTQSSSTPIVESTPVVTTNPLEGWKIYSNPVDNYSIKYPTDWKVESTKGGVETYTPVLNSPCNYDSGQLCSQIYIETGKYDPQKKFEPTFIINLTSPKPDMVSNKTSVIVDGEIAEGFELFQPNYGDKGRLLYVLVTNHKNTKYSFIYEESQKNRNFQTGSDWQNKTIFDQIISTFQFTDQASPSPSPINLSKSQVCLDKTTCKGTAPCMANPAAVFCTCMGGVSSIKNAADGSQSGLCTIDGKVYDEWTYFRQFTPEDNSLLPKQ